MVARGSSDLARWWRAMSRAWRQQASAASRLPHALPPSLSHGSSRPLEPLVKCHREPVVALNDQLPSSPQRLQSEAPVHQQHKALRLTAERHVRRCRPRRLHLHRTVFDEEVVGAGMADATSMAYTYAVCSHTDDAVG